MKCSYFIQRLVEEDRWKVMMTLGSVQGVDATVRDWRKGLRAIA
jgi:hypothetical protein